MEIYTDGAVSNNGYNNACGGWAYLLMSDNFTAVKRSGQSKEDPTNQRMELMAIIKSLQHAIELAQPDEIINVHSDSAYCINCYNQNWWVSWLANNWKNSKKQPVANRDLWEQLIPFFRKSNINFIKVQGHSTNIYNNIVDKMAVAAKEGYCVRE